MGTTAKFGFNVISHVSGNLGIGVTARNVLRVLLERGCPVSVLDIDPGMGRHGHDRSYDAYTVDSLRNMPYGINLFILPPSTISHLLPQALIIKPGCLNVAWSMWELPVLPEAWTRPLEMLDVLIAQSEFIRYAFEFNLSHVQTIAGVHPLYLPNGIRADRARFGLPPDGVIFITSFDPYSDPQRKNPFAAIRAFIAELGNDTNAHLVIKLNNAQISGQMHPVLEQLMELCAGHPRVRLLTESMSYSDVLNLYASCDVFVSLHRAEGLGLGPMEAMALGKVVIATGWSGNMTYMDHSNACPVGYRLIPVEASIVDYNNQSLRKEALWADPDVQQAAAWMRRLMDDTALRASLGARARDDIARHQARAREGAFIDELRAIWEHQLQLASVDADACPGASQDVVRQRSERLTDYLRWYAEQGTASLDEMYQSRISRQAINEEVVQRYRERMQQWQETPVVHVIIDLQPGQESRLADTIDSLAGQLLDNWRLSVIAGQPAPNELFNELDVLRWELVPEGGDRGAAVNKVAAEVAADWVSLGTAGDRYATLFSCALADHVNCHPQLRLIYSDDDCITADGKHIDVRFKPDFNLDLLRSMPYMGECCVLRRDLLRELGGYALNPDARNYDIALRVLDAVGEATIGHIADVLYHRCAEDAETPANEGRIEQCRQALISHLQRNGVEAKVQHGLLPGSYFVDYRHAGQPLVSIIVPTHDRADLLQMCIASLLEKTDYPNYEILVIDNNTTQPAALELLDSYADIPRVRVLRHPGEFNFAAINNHAVQEARGEYLLLLNNDTVVLQANWLTRLMAHGQRPEVGIVGARLVYPDQRLQHAGIVLGMGGSGVAEHPFMGLPMTDAGYMGRAQVVQNYAGVTAACLLIRKSLYVTVGGMDERCFKVFYNDVDLCLKVGKQGFKIVWTPFVTLIHHGSASLKATAEKPAKIARARSEAFVMYERWLPALANDAAYNRNLSLVCHDPRPDVDFIVPWRDTDRALPRIAGFMLGSEGSWLYRVGSPLEVLNRERRADCAVMTRYEDRVRVPTVAELARIDPDIMLLHNTVHDSHLYMLELYKKFNRAFRVFGADDLMFALHGKNPFQKTVFRDMKKRIRTCLSLCDRLVVSTVPLAEAYRSMIDDIRVVPNYLDSAHWGHLKSLRRQGDKPRVGWAGATQHQGDLELIIDAVKETSKEVDWVFLGMCPEEIRPYVSEFHKGVPLAAYPEKLASLNLDLAVAPLEYHRFNEAKSNLRILEYGVLGWPVICSNIYPYQDAPVERVSNNPRAWINAIRARIHDLDATAAEGDRLHDWVLSGWMLEDHLDAWLAALNPRTGMIGAVHGGKPQRASG